MPTIFLFRFIHYLVSEIENSNVENKRFQLKHAKTLPSTKTWMGALGPIILRTPLYVSSSCSPSIWMLHVYPKFLFLCNTLHHCSGRGPNTVRGAPCPPGCGPNLMGCIPVLPGWVLGVWGAPRPGQWWRVFYSWWKQTLTIDRVDQKMEQIQTTGISKVFNIFSSKFQRFHNMIGLKNEGYWTGRSENMSILVNSVKNREIATKGVYVNKWFVDIA